MIGGGCMNMIVCGERCVHQKDGYCILERITSLTSDAQREQCAYFQKRGSRIHGSEGGGYIKRTH